MTFPTPDELAPAVAYAFAGVTLVFVGLERADGELAATLAAVAPLLASMLHSEQKIFVAQGELAVAHETAERAAALARALDVARLEAERATKVKDDFLAMLGHELRNPLAPIVSALHMMKLDGQHTRMHDILERQVGNLLRLVDDLLDVSRITRGKVELRRERIEIAVVVARALEQAGPLLEQHRNEVIVAVPAAGLTVDGDPARLAQVIANLVTNAAKYSDPGSRICIVADRAGTDVHLHVEDQGIGIAPEFLERVFEQFVQVPQGLDRSAGGLGLGLAIVRSLIALHGGSVRATSAGHGKGSTFTIELPRCESEPAAEAVAAPRIARPRATYATVLIVDDNRDAADLLGDALQGFGYKVKVVHSAHEALAAVDHVTPDVALLDIGLPVIDGYELAQELLRRLPDLLLIAVTGYGQANDRDRALSAGFAAHFVKPISITTVTETLDRLLQ